MAYYAALLSTIELLEDILHPHRFPNCFLGYNPTFNSLHQKFTRLLVSLQDYSSIGRDALLLEAQIKDASFQALDIIESRVLEHQHESKEKLSMMIKKSLERLVLKVKLQKVGREVDSIVQKLIAIKQTQKRERRIAAAATAQPPPTAPIDINNRVVGFEEQAMSIKEQLCGSSQLQFIPIVGMGGIGKTTLATHTFHDPHIVSQFDFRGWVTISQDYNVVRVLQDIVNSLGIIVEKHEMEEEIAMKDCIHKYLKWRKFLIVIDDIWNTNVWDDIKAAFPNDHSGSRVVLTTRLNNVADYVGSIDSLHQVQFLDASASWTLLQEKAFVKECCPLELVNVGKCIASKCRGLPLAIVVIGGVLSNNKTLQYWKSIADNVSLVLSKDDEYLSNILSLSYNNLPHHLKPCFLHMGSFPEDYEINISKLIKLWIAEGFLKTVGNTKDLEEIGDDYLKDLVKRSLVIFTTRKANGEFKSCIMHDLLRDFCKQKGHGEHFFHITDWQGCLETNGMEKIRRIVLDSIGPFSPFTPWEYDNGMYVRSIYQFRMKRISIYVEGLKWDRINLLRILDTPLCTRVVPFAVSNMCHLKYLVLTSYLQTEHCIDPSISKLQNLETLVIDCQDFDLVLPSEIWEMSWLKYLITTGRITLPTIPDGFPLKKLEHLCTLQTPDSFVFTNKVTQTIPNIRKLKIAYEDTKGGDMWDRYHLNNLINLCQLEKLSIIFDCSIFPCDYFLWDRFAFPQNLKKLSLRGCELLWEAMTLVGSLKYLQVLKLREDAFVGEVWEPVKGEFRELKFLLLERLDLMHWRAENIHFPKLQHLKIFLCRDLKEIPLDIGEIGTLKFITVENCREQVGDSAKKIQEEQHDLGNYGLQVIVGNRTCFGWFYSRR